MDSIKKIEEISSKNNEIFEKIFLNEAILTRTRDRVYTYAINGNYLYRMGGEGAYLEATFNRPEFAWLLNAKFKADYIFIKGDQLTFTGDWYSGSFEGYSFATGSNFIGGEFKGERYEAGNKSFKAPPEKYFKGIWENPQDGILGVEMYKEPIENTADGIELAAVPTGWFVTVLGEGGEKLTFRVIKKLDDKDTNFVFQIYPNLQKLQVLWETIRTNYLNNGHIVKGMPFNLLGATYQIGQVDSIFVTNEQPGERVSAKDTVDFSLDPKLKGFLSYKNTAIPIEIDSSSQEGKDFVEQFKKDLPRGVFSDLLKNLAGYISSGIVRGFSDDEFVGLAPIFNNIRGIKVTDNKARELMSYLNKFMLYIAGEAADVDTNNLITESVLKIKTLITNKIKQALKTNTYVPYFQRDPVLNRNKSGIYPRIPKGNMPLSPKQQQQKNKDAEAQIRAFLANKNKKKSE